MTSPRISLELGKGDSGASPRRLRDLIETGWTDCLRRKIVAYDPARADMAVAHPYRFHYLPARAERPGAVQPPAPPPQGLFAPHAPCPFDGEAFVRKREMARIRRGDRIYHLTCNRYPVAPRHFLVIRSEDAPRELLPQHFHGQEEIEDLLLMLELLGEPFRIYFNSNRGADNSQSGSSVNHWHLQVFPHRPAGGSAPLELPAEMHREGPELWSGRVPSWPAHHVLVEAGPGGVVAVSRLLWRKLRGLHEINAAYNLEAIALENGRYRVFLFPRRPGTETEVPGWGTFHPNFGGWELSGDIVVPTGRLLQWCRARPADAVRLSARRLRETTRPPP